MKISKEIHRLADECACLTKDIKLFEKKLEIKKKILLKKMSKENIKTIEGDNYKIRHTFYTNDYSQSLKEGFSNLGADIISGLINDNLITVSYKLNPSIYQLLVNTKKQSALDAFVNEKKSKSFLAIKINRKS